ncbi:MAG: hypothetical protein HWE11_04800 [Gammaproteobacteria bacterium]|nr:hypothetical protein [Gammaproteobacteria bacterium]
MECKYHPQVPASWHCSRCDIAYCVDCVAAPERNSFIRCSLCRSYLTPVGVSQTITPFWLQIGQFFTYPLNPGLLILAAVLSVLFPFLFASFSFSLFWFALFFGWNSLIYKIFYSIMELTAGGDLTPPKISQVFSLKNYSILFKLFVIIFVLGTSAYKLLGFSLILGLVYIVFLVFAYPAINIILCIDKSLMSALNPARMIRIMVSIGWSYWLLFAFIVLFSISINIASSYTMTLFPFWIALGIQHFLYLILSFAMYHMIGYTIYQYHFELDHSVDRFKMTANLQQQRGAKSGNEPSSLQQLPTSSLADAKVYLQEGRYDDAEQSLRDALKANDTQEEVYELLYRLYIQLGKKSLMTKLCDKHLSVLMRTKARNLMKMSYFKVLEYNPDYFPNDADTLIELIKACNRKEEVKQAYRLFKFLKQEHIEHPQLAEVTFVLAKLLAEKLNRREDAAKLIRWGLNIAKDDLKVQMQQYVSYLT